MTARRLLMIIIAALLATSALADESFTLTIPARVGRPSGRVQLTLYLAGSPAGSKIAIGGEDVFTDGGTTTLANAPRTGDKVKVFSIPGNAITINYRALSLFQGGKFCDEKLGIPNGDRAIAINFTGPAITGYRLNTYVAPSNLFGCDQAAKRISLTPATVSFAGMKTNKGRHPLDVILVLDQSGSMSDPPGPGTMESKWSILKKAVTTFIDRWEIVDAPSGTQDNLDDRLGVVLFQTNASTAAGPFFFTRGANPDATWDPLGVPPVIPAADPPGNNMTALGKGLDLAIDKHVADPVNDTVFIVMSDGMQNQLPEVVPGNDTHLELEPTAGPPNQPLYLQGVPMETLFFGVPGGSGEAVLEQIAMETSGTHTTEVTPLTVIDNAFGNALVGALKGNTISLASSRKGSISSSTMSPLFPLIVDPSAARVMLSLFWSGPKAAMNVQLFPPNASPGPNDPGLTPTTRTARSESVIAAWDNLAPGTYLMRVVPVQSGSVEFPTQFPATDYSLSAHFLERHLDFQFSFDDVRAGTGQSITVRAEVAYDGQPLAGLPPNAIRVRISRPGEAIGTILHDSDATGAGQTPADIDPYGNKLKQLSASDDLINRVQPKPVSTISLTDAGNGIYTGTFTDTTLPGLYTFDTLLDWDDPRTGRLQRDELLNRHVRVLSDPAKTTITTSAGPNPGTVLVSVTPRDKFGNYVGPGYAGVVKATVNSGGTLVSVTPTDPNQTGTYVFTVGGVAPGTTPDVSVVVDGDPVGSTHGGGMVPPGSGGFWGPGAWRWFVDAGVNFPHGTLSNFADGSWSANAGLERLFANNWSVEGILGYHAFDVAFVNDAHVWQLSVNGKKYFGTSSLRPFVNGGVGGYRFDPGADNEFGWNVGGGVLKELNAKWGVEAVYNYHSVDSGNAEWSTVQIGVRGRF